jgi:hypothetical protein
VKRGDRRPRRGEGGEERSRDEAWNLVGLDAPGRGVFRGGVHEADDGGDHPPLRQVGAERFAALASPDDGLDAAQHAVVQPRMRCAVSSRCAASRMLHGCRA